MAHSEPGPVKASALPCWLSEEFDAGYKARFLEVEEYRTATLSWRAGWQEADRELTWCIAGDWSVEPRTVAHAWSFYGNGEIARACDLPFEARETEEWKRSWVAADIVLGMTRRGRSGQAPGSPGAP